MSDYPTQRIWAHGELDSARPATIIDGISVIVATYSKHAKYTQRLLDSLQAAAVGLDVPWECIFVDGPPSSSSDTMESICKASGAQYLQASHRVSSKINLGAAHARYNLILDLGADCFPGPGFLAAHVAAMQGAPPNIAGAAGPVMYDGGRSLHWRVADFYGYNACYDWGTHDSLLRWAPINVSFLTSVFREIGGYPEDGWTPSGGDDVALGVRLSSVGKSLLTAPAAGVTTPRSDLTFLAMLRSLVRYGKADAWLCRSFPDGRMYDLNPFGPAAPAACVAAWASGGRRVRTGLVIGAMSLLAQPSSRLWYYARKARRAQPPTADRLANVAGAVLLTLTFKFGTVSAAVAKGRPELLLYSFDYSSDPVPTANDSS